MWATRRIVRMAAWGATCSLPLMLRAAPPDFRQPFVEQQKQAHGPELGKMYGQSPDEQPGLFKRLGSAIKGKPKQPQIGGPMPSDKNDPLSLARKPKAPDAQFYSEIARFQEQGKNYDGAEQSYRKALQMAPNDRDCLVGLARLVDLRGRPDEAIKVFEACTRAHPQDPTAFNDLGMCLAKRERYTDAAAALSRAVQLDGKRKLYRNNMAMVLVELRRYDEALVQLAAAHGEAVAHYNLGYILSQRGDLQPAKFHFEKALEKQPDFAEARQWVDVLVMRLHEGPGPAPANSGPTTQRLAQHPPLQRVVPPTSTAPPGTSQSSVPSSSNVPPVGAALDSNLQQPASVASTDVQPVERIRDLPTPVTTPLNTDLPKSQRSSGAGQPAPSTMNAASQPPETGAPEAASQQNDATSSDPDAEPAAPRAPRNNGNKLRSLPPSRY